MALGKKIKHFPTREKQIEYLFEGVYEFKKVLYVGAQVNSKKPQRMPSCLNLLRTISSRIDCLEIFEPYLQSLRKKGWFDKVYQGDIRDGIPEDDYDLIFWWHGPEHLEKEDALSMLTMLPEWAPCIWLACPWGDRPQGAFNGNEYERHRCALYADDFQKYNILLAGNPDKKGSNIIAYNRKEVTK